jgi:hypothetical protein
MGRNASGDVGVVGVGSGLGIDGFGQLYATGGASGSTSGSGSTNQVAYWTGTNVLSGENNLWWDFSADRLGIGTNAPARSLDVIGGIRFSTVNGTPTAIIGRDASGDIGSVSIGTGLGLSAGVLSFTGSTGGSGTVTGTGTTNYLSKWASASGLTDSIILETGSTIDINGSLRVRTSSGTATNVMGRDANGYVSNLSIGSGLSVSGGTLSTTGVTFGTGADGRVAYWTGTNQIGNDNNFLWDAETDRLGIGVFPTSALHISSANSASIRIVKTGTSPADFSLVALNGKLDIGSAFTITDTGRLGLGTNAPAQTLDVAGNMRLTGSTGTSATVMGRSVDGDISAISVGSGLSLSGNVLTTTGGTSGTVTGTGTVNYLSKWASSTGLTNSIALETGNTIDIAGSLRVTTASGTATLIAGQDANGYFSRITVGSGLSLAGNTLTATGGGSGTVSGSGTATQVAFWNGTTSLTGNTNLYWDNNNNRLGIGTSSPSNQLTTTSDALISTLTIGRGNNSIANNTAIGVNALANNAATLVSGNTAVGFQTITGNTFGGFNSAFGNLALSKTTTGNSNTAIGSDALTENTTGNSNTAVGRTALSNNTVGGSNVAIGASAFLNNISGSTSIAIGAFAGNLNNENSPLTNIISSIFIGASTKGTSASPSNQIVIGVGTTALADNSTIIGTTGTTRTHLYGNLSLGLTSADTTARVKATSSDATSGSFAAKFQNNSGTDILSVRGDGLVGIGTTSPAQTLDIRGTMRLTGSTGDSTTVMGRNANGDVSAISVGSGLSLSGNTLSTSGSTGVSGSGTATQVAFWSGATGTTSTALTSSMGLTWDNVNNRLGINSLPPSNGRVQITSNGLRNLIINSTGNESTGSVLFTGGDNAFLSSEESFFICIDADNNQSNRLFAVKSNTYGSTGGINAFSVDENGNTTCGGIVSVGDYRLDVLASSNTASPLGAVRITGVGTVAGKNTLLVRNSNNTRLFLIEDNGDISFATGSTFYWNATNTRLGIGTASPSARLHVVGSGNTTGTTFLTQSSGGTNPFAILDNGNVGVNNSNPQQTLHVAGTMRLTGSTGTSTTVMGRDANGDVSAISVGSGLNLSGNTLTTTGSTGVSGSGTATQVAFWGGTTTLSGSSNLYWDNTNGRLGIANSSPTARLYVKGSTSGNGSTAFEVTDNNDRDIINVRDDGRITLGRNLASAVQSSVTIEAVGSETNIGIAIVPKGTGAITAQIPDNGTTGGNARGQYAVDLQTYRGSANQVASGDYSAIVGGGNNRVTGNYSGILAGFNNLVSSDNSYIIGGANSIASGNTSIILGGSENRSNGIFSSVVGGWGAKSYLYGQVTSSSGFIATYGDAQTSNIRLRREITGSGQTELFLDGSSARALLTDTNKVWLANIFVVATVQNIGTNEIATGDTFSGSYIVTIKKKGTTTSLVGTGSGVHTETTASDSSMATSVVTIDANDDNDSLRIRFTPPSNFSATTVTRVVATVYLTEVGF